jgi:LAO/AO transport system kinase
VARPVDVETLSAAVLAGDRAALARAITLVESTRDDHRARSVELLARVLDRTGRSVRVGISGTPGVGKSTLIESLGKHLVDDLGRRVAVLAVDPSSRRTGGSILGDKTRMAELSRSPNAFIRPSPSSGTLGGVARRTREVMLLCEAAGFDVVLVETVGVGQSETAVAGMTDLFLLLVAPAGGDELQGVKRGVMELADVLAVNKCDGDLRAQAMATLADYGAALQLTRRPHGLVPRSLAVSAATGEGIDGLWSVIADAHGELVGSGELARRRADQQRSWLWDEVRERVLAAFHADPVVAGLAPSVEADVVAGRMLPGDGAARLLGAWHR